MKSNYTLVRNQIIEISSNWVRFATDNGEVFLERKSITSNVIIWKLLSDGIYVHDTFFHSYSLSATPK